MARCGCQQTCTCAVEGASTPSATTSVGGTGAAESPYAVSAAVVRLPDGTGPLAPSGVNQLKEDAGGLYVSPEAGTGIVDSVVAGAGISVNSADPANPVVTAEVTQAELDAHVNDASAAHAASAVSYAGGTGMAATDVEAAIDELATEKADKATFPVLLGVALSDETTPLTTGLAKAAFHAPFAFTLTEVRSGLSTASSSGLVTVDINEGAGAGTSLLSTKLSIDANEETSTTAAAPAVISDSAIADAARLTFDIDAAGTGAKGLKVWLIGTRVLA
jgi:hypothetical protein